KFFIVTLSLVLASVMADVSELGYEYHDYAAAVAVESYAPPAVSPNGYLPPAASVPVETYAPVAPAPAPVEYYAPPAVAGNSYLPPAPAASAPAPVEYYAPPAVSNNGYLPPAASAPAPVEYYAPPAVTSNSYIPPAASIPDSTYAAPVSNSIGFEGAYSEQVNFAPSASAGTDFGDDGYRYRTVRRRVYRRRY
uniref:Uncharacterized protein n=1 Tax=Musca domestica TaxID=7370 RepID=A0A1I8MWK1_MUSDO